MARPRKIDLRDKDWPVVRQRKLKDGVSRSWMVDSVVAIAGQGRIRKTFKTEDAALTYSATIRTQYANAGALGFALSDTERADAENAIKALKGGSANCTLSAAVEFYLRHNRPEAGDITLNDLRERFLENRREARLREDSLADLSRRTQSFVRFVGGERFAKAVGADDIRIFIKRAGVTDVTRRNDFTVIRALFTFAMHPSIYQGRNTARDAAPTGWIGSNPCATIARPKSDADVEPSILDVETASRLMRAAYASRGRYADGTFFDDEHLGLLPYIALGIFAGLRPSEIRRLDWRQLHLTGRQPTVTITKSKTRAGVRQVDLSRTAMEWLKLCPTPHSGKLVEDSNFAKRWRRLLALAEITEWQPDAMRHTFASAHYRTGQNAAKTAAQLGHAGEPTLLFAHYRSMMSADVAKKLMGLTPAIVLAEIKNVISISVEIKPPRNAKPKAAKAA